MLGFAASHLLSRMRLDSRLFIEKYVLVPWNFRILTGQTSQVQVCDVAQMMKVP